MGILDASECPPTFGVDNNLVIGVIAGGDKAIRNSQEFAEDSTNQGWFDLKEKKINKKDFVNKLIKFSFLILLIQVYFYSLLKKFSKICSLLRSNFFSNCPSHFISF